MQLRKGVGGYSRRLLVGMLIFYSRGQEMTEMRLWLESWIVVKIPHGVFDCIVVVLRVS